MIFCRQYQDEISRRHELHLEHNPLPSHNEQNSLVAALQQGLSLDCKSQDATNDISQLSTVQLVKKVQKCYEDVRRIVTITTINTDKLLGREVDFSSMPEGFT